MAEWSNAIDSKSIVPISGTQGSNPCLTANKQKTAVIKNQGCFFVGAFITQSNLRVLK